MVFRGKATGAELAVRALEDSGIRYTFGIPGTHNIELYDALRRSQRVTPILVTDEQSASFMADGVWRASGTLGCVNLVPGAGLTHALSGIAEAYMDCIPMLVLGCGVRTDTDRSYQLHDIDQTAIARPVTKAQLRPDDGSHIYQVIRRACEIATAPPGGPVFVEIPVNFHLFRHVADPDSWRPATRPESRPERATLRRVVERLGGSRRPLLYLGLGAAGAGAGLIALAERLEAPVATTIQGKGVFPESHPLWLWCGLGATAPPFVREVAKGCDAMLAIGCRFSEVGTGSYGFDPPGPLIHVDIDPAVPGRNFPAAEKVIADAGAFVKELLPELSGRRPDKALRSTIAAGHAAIERDWTAGGSDERVSPHALLRAIQELFGPDTAFTTDSGNGTFLAMEHLRLDRPRSFLAPVDYSCMGYSVPAAVGASLACPDRPVVALAGDGAFLMTGLELLTAAQLAVPVTVIVLRDRELAQIAQFQRTALAREASSRLPDYDLSSLATALGVAHLRAETDAEVPPVLARARDLNRNGEPALVEVAIDYSRPSFFTRGVVKTNLLRLPWPDRLRFVGRALGRRLSSSRE